MGQETILKKVNDRLYIKPCKREDGTDFDIKWEKELEPMWLDLTDIKLCHEFSVEHPVFHREHDILLGNVKAEDKWEWEKYERHEWRSIEASGKLRMNHGWFTSDSIGLIAKDGTTKSKVFTQVKLFIRKMAGDFTQADIEGRRVNGHMYYWGFPGADAHVLLDFGIPAESFDTAYRELQEVKHREVSLCIFVDVFNSEVDRGLRDPDMPREFFIEAEWVGNQIFFSKLIISELVSNSPDKEISSEENKSDATDFQTEHRKKEQAEKKEQEKEAREARQEQLEYRSTERIDEMRSAIRQELMWVGRKLGSWINGLIIVVAIAYGVYSVFSTFGAIIGVATIIGGFMLWGFWEWFKEKRANWKLWKRLRKIQTFRQAWRTWNKFYALPSSLKGYEIKKLEEEKDQKKLTSNTLKSPAV